MRSQFLLIPAALVVALPATATNYMSLEKAQKLMFPGATFTPHFVSLNEDRYEALIQDSGVTVWQRNIKSWHVSTGGWFILDQVAGRDDWISYVVALDEDGTVKHIEILECLDHYDQVTNPQWLAQFNGKRHGALAINGDIEIATGATLSSIHITEGVKRLLSTYALFLTAPNG